MLNDLYNKKIDLMFVSSDYVTLYQNTEGFEDIDNQVKVILEKDKTIKKETNNTSLIDFAKEFISIYLSK